MAYKRKPKTTLPSYAPPGDTQMGWDSQVRDMVTQTRENQLKAISDTGDHLAAKMADHQPGMSAPPQVQPVGIQSVAMTSGEAPPAVGPVPFPMLPNDMPQPPEQFSPTQGMADMFNAYNKAQRKPEAYGSYTPFGFGGPGIGYGIAGSVDPSAGGTFLSGAW
jgi:hypothetical protein